MASSEKVVLLVEDNEDDIELTLRAFRKNKIANEVVVARDGVEALDLLFAEGEHAGTKRLDPQVVLLDIKMPRVDGFEVLARVRSDARTRSLPVVMLTSSKEEDDMIRAYELGSNSYIRKPVDFDQFAHAVQQLGLYWLVLNETPSSA